MEWLGELLSAGPRAQAEVQAAAMAAGHAWATVRRAADELGVKRDKSGWSGGWVWSLVGDLSPEEEIEL